MFALKDTCVLITGACGGIATAALEAFNNEGARIVGVDRNVTALAALKERGLLADSLAGDLTDPAVQDAIIERFGGEVDVLINNVGAGFSRTLEDTTREDFRQQFQLNFEVAAMLCRGIMPSMADRGGGKVINVSTVLADNPLPTLAAYAASKAALIAFTKAVALQFAPLNVQANVLSPGYITNPKHEAYFATDPGKHFMERFMPTGVTGDRTAVTGALLFMSSSLSDYMTGHVLKIDGGYSIW